MSEATEKFIRLYERLVQEVNRRAGKMSSHTFAIEDAASRDRAIEKNKALLMYIRNVRHLLQHPQHQSTGHAVLVSDAFLEEVFYLLKSLRKPLTSGSLGVTRKQIRVARRFERLGDLADDMKAGAFSHVPIVSDQDEVLGVFNEAAIFHYLWREPDRIVERNMTVDDVMPYCQLSASRTDTFHFIGPNVSIEELTDRFLKIESATSRVGAFFVTASGKKTEKLDRLITLWDVLGGVAR